MDKTSKAVLVIISLLLVSVVYIKAQSWEPYEGWFTHNTDYLLQQVVALEHPDYFKNDFIYHDPKYITWNPQGMIFLTRLIYRVTEDPFVAVKYLAFAMCFVFALGYFFLFREITNSLFLGLLLSLTLVFFYDHYWGNGFGMPGMVNLWARVFFKVFLGWLIFFFIRIINKPKFWPIFGLFLGIIGALVHPKPILAWAGAFCGTLMILSLKGMSNRRRTLPKLNNGLFLSLMILGVFVPIFLWAVFGARILDRPDYVTQEILSTIKADRSGLTWYLWQVLPQIFDGINARNDHIGTALLFSWAVFGLYTYFKNVKNDQKVKVLTLCCIMFFSIIIIIPSLEYILIKFTNKVPHLSPLSVNFDAIRLWLLIIGAPGIAYWSQTRLSLGNLWKLRNNYFTTVIEKHAKIFFICPILLVASINLDWNTTYGWVSPGLKTILRKTILDYNMSGTFEKFIGRKIRWQDDVHSDFYFREALNAAKNTPKGSVFYCYNAMNYVRVGSLRPVVFSVDDKQKSVVSKVTFDRYLIAKKTEEYLKNNKPELMPFDKALQVYKKLGAEYVFDKRRWPEPGKDARYEIFFQNRDWTIIKLVKNKLI